MDVRAQAVHDSGMPGERSSLAPCAPVIDLRVARVLRALRADPARPWRVRELTKIAGASRASLARLFRAAVGVSPKRWLTAYRLEQAANLLQESDRTLAEVATDVGYVTEFALSRAFKRRFGVSPARYRKPCSLTRCAA
jgi:transcriptional regulator GlxA family with amidase domain